MKRRLIGITTLALFLIPMLLILGNSTISSKAMRLDQSSSQGTLAPVKKTFYAEGGLYDGWVLESGEFTGIGGSKNTASATINLGDDAKNRQYRGIISFNTDLLPPYATVQAVTLYLTGNGVVGINPFGWADLKVDIKGHVFGGNKYLELIDFQAPANLLNAGSKASCPATGKCPVSLSTQSFAYLNRDGLTQFRLRFVPDDNNNKKADYYKVFSADTGIKTNKPYLVIQYFP